MNDKPELKLEVGKRYVTRRGWVTPSMESRESPTGFYPFGVDENTWTVTGKYSTELLECRLDLISEYQEPVPAQWILCKDRMPVESDGCQETGDSSDRGKVIWWTTGTSGILVRKWSDPSHDAVAWLPIPRFTPSAPEKKQLPLGPDDVVPGTVFRYSPSNSPGWCAPSSVLGSGLEFALSDGVRHIPWEELEKHWLYRPPGGMWTPCWKEEACADCPDGKKAMDSAVSPRDTDQELLDEMKKVQSVLYCGADKAGMMPLTAEVDAILKRRAKP